MRVLLHIFGHEILDLHIGDTTTEDDSDQRGSWTTYPIGFAPTPPIQLEGTPDRWAAEDE